MDLTYTVDLPPACLVFPSDEMGEGGDVVGSGHARDGSTGQVRGSWRAAMGKSVRCISLPCFCLDKQICLETLNHLHLFAAYPKEGDTIHSIMS